MRPDAGRQVDVASGHGVNLCAAHLDGDYEPLEVGRPPVTDGPRGR